MASFFDPEHVTPTEILRQLGVRPNKTLGQHFLHDRNVVDRIVRAADVSSDDTIVEFGPGLGIMTSALAKTAQRVIAIEKDDFFSDYLTGVAPSNVEIVRGDALDIDVGQLARGKYKIVANLPYNAGNAIIRRSLGTENPPDSMTLMIQQEVARRIVAEPPEMSLLAVSVQFYADARYCFRVGRGAFTPAPNVDSGVIRLDKHRAQLPEVDIEPFFRVVRAGFAQRRKQLANTLTSGLAIDKSEATAALESASLSPHARPETLDLDDWISLYRALEPILP